MASPRFLRSMGWGTIGCSVVSLALGCGPSAGADDNGGGDTNDVRTVGRRPAAGPFMANPLPPPPPGETSDYANVAGRWFLNRGSTRLVLDLAIASGRLTGTQSVEGTDGAAIALQQIAWNHETGELRFRCYEAGEWLGYTVTVVEGTLSGRYAAESLGTNGMAPSAHKGHVMGWRKETFDRDLVPRVFDVVVDDGRFVRIRLDRDPLDRSLFTGDFKLKATTEKGSDGELPAQPIFVRRWDGDQLVFDLAKLSEAGVRQRFTGRVSGRSIAGSMTESQGAPVKFEGTRGNVLSYGLSTKSVEEREEWQDRVRRILYRLMMAGNPAPLATSQTVTERPLFPLNPAPPARDDNEQNWPRNYRLSDVVFEHSLPGPYGSEPLTRHNHGFLAVPTTPPPPDGYGVVLALNGHGGSAQQAMQSDGGFWYGDSFARRGYVVLAMDVSHRPPSDAGGLYWDPVDGDSPETGNHAHPSIAAPGLDSDWAEDGERVWDAMRGIDFLLAQPSIDPNRVIVTGLSLGGEVTELVGALDQRVTTSIPASAPPDLSMILIHGNHLCWQWTHGDATEYIEMSDFLALTAPRRLMLESGKADWTYSSYEFPYALEKENAWRGRIAYGDEASNLVHYIHSAHHQYRVGDSSEESPYPVYVQIPEQVAPPGARRRSIDWEVDGKTVSLNQTLFDFVAR